jgi:hypothetical protein
MIVHPDIRRNLMWSGWSTATQWLMQHAISNPDNGGAVSMDYLYMMALVMLGYQWAQVARICENQLSNPDDDSFDRRFYQQQAGRAPSSSWRRCCRRPWRIWPRFRPAPIR